MYADIEDSLAQELSQVAESVAIPPMPALPSEPARVRRNWAPLLVAASMALIAGCAVLVLFTRGGEAPGPAPAPATPTESSTESVAGIPTTQPTESVYVVGDQLWAFGKRIEGRWWLVRSERARWLALRQDNTWWAGYGPDISESLGQSDSPPKLSTDGVFVGQISRETGQTILTGTNLVDGDDGLGSIPIEPGEAEDGRPVTLRAAFDDGRFIVQGAQKATLWQPWYDTKTVDLSETAPGQVFVGATSAGLIVTDGEGGRPYLAEISEAGVLGEIQGLPEHDDISFSPGSIWMAWTPSGTTGGEVTATSTLQVRLLNYTDVDTLHAPEGWNFKVRAWTWEGDDYIIAPLLRDNGKGRERLARCRVLQLECVVIKSP